MNQPVSVCLRVEQPFPLRQRLPQAFAPPGFIQLPCLAGVQHAHADGGIGIEQANRKKLIPAIVNGRQFTQPPFTILRSDASGEEPRMAGAKV